MNKGFALSKKFRYGSVASVFTVMFIAFIIVINVITTALANKYLWYIDMTKEQIFSLSQECIDYIGDLGGKEVNIYFCMEPDKLEQNEYLKMVYNTALELEKNIEGINIICKDSIKNLAFYQKFQTTSTSTINTQSVIIENAVPNIETGKNEYRVMTLQAFFIQNEDGRIWAYNGESKFASMILQVTAAESRPIVCFTSQHGEDLSQTSSFMSLASLFVDAGYDVQPINLSKEEIPKDTRIVIINNPVYDFMGAEAEDAAGNEIDKLDAFLDDFGALIVFSSPDYAANLVNLSEFLEEWGIAFTPSTYVRDMANSVSTDGRSVSAQYTSDTLGASLYTDISKLGATMPRTIIKNAMPIQILWDTGTGGGLSGSRDVSAVLLSSTDAEVMQDGKAVSTGKQENLMTISRETRIINNEYYYSYVIACGSGGYSDYLISNTYANRDILYSAMRAVGKEKVPADLKFKVFETYNLDITTAESNQWTLVLTLALPIVIGLCGTVIFIRRKNA